MNGSIRRFAHWSLGDYFLPDSPFIKNSGLHGNRPETAVLGTRADRERCCFLGNTLMPYALFLHEAKLSKAYPTEADVWHEARKSGLVVDADEEEPDPRRDEERPRGEALLEPEEPRRGDQEGGEDRLDAAVDQVRDRFGKASIGRTTLVSRPLRDEAPMLAD